MIKAISDAVSRLQPTRMAYGTGASYINVNRNLIDPKTHRWWEGPNYDGPSDKTVVVIRFETPDRKPIGVYPGISPTMPRPATTRSRCCLRT